jgi:ribosomal protein S24E
MEIKKDFNNLLAKRREVQFVLEFPKNPNFVEITGVVAKEFKAQEDCVLVEGIKGAFGSKMFLITSSIYETKELKDIAEKRMTKVKKVVGQAS